MKCTLSLAQIDVATAKPQANLEKAVRLIEEAKTRHSDLIVFPEMWTTGFHWEKNKKIAKEHEKTIRQVQDLAKTHRIWINGSMLSLNEKKKVTNTSFLFSPQGNLAALYRKTHLFSLMEENKHMTAGNELTVFKAPWGKTGLAVCYDLRFPELFRTYALQGVKLVLLPAAWPHPRFEHWKFMLRARAIENQMFVAAVNRIGEEKVGGKKKTAFFGHSTLLNPWGKTLAEGSSQAEELLTATIDLREVDQTRKNMKVLKDRRPELYRL